MTSRPRRHPRPGFTLIEVLLAALLAALVLAGVYAIMHVTVQQTTTTRDAVEIEGLSRGIFNKMERDMSGTLAPLPPKSGGNSAASGGTTSSSSSGSAPSSGSTPSTGSAPSTGMTPSGGSSAPAAATPDMTTPAAGTTDPAAPGATDNATAVSASPPFQGGLYCQDPQTLVLFLGRTPEVYSRQGNPGEQVRSDQRQVVYKFVPGRGLFRAERHWVTADNLTLDLDPDAPDAKLLADEVADATFEFADASGEWATTWDGTVPGPDGVTPLGPPRAVKVTLKLQVAVTRGEPVTRTVSQVIAVRAAPGSFTPTLLDAPTDGGDNPTTGGTGGTGGSTPSGGSTGGNSGGTSGGSSGGTTGGKTGGSPPSMPSMPSGGATGGKTGGTPGGSTGGTPGGSTGGRPGGTTGGTPGGMTGGGKGGGR